MLPTLISYVKEIKFFIHLNDNIEPEELKHKGLADTPFQQKMVEYLYNQITSQKLIVTKQRMKIQSTEASLTDFVHDIKTPVTVSLFCDSIRVKYNCLSNISLIRVHSNNNARFLSMSASFSIINFIAVTGVLIS